MIIDFEQDCSAVDIDALEPTVSNSKKTTRGRAQAFRLAKAIVKAQHARDTIGMIKAIADAIEYAVPGEE